MDTPWTHRGRFDKSPGHTVDTTVDTPNERPPWTLPGGFIYPPGARWVGGGGRRRRAEQETENHSQNRVESEARHGADPRPSDRTVPEGRGTALPLSPRGGDMNTDLTPTAALGGGGPVRRCLDCQSLGPWGRDGRCWPHAVQRAQQLERQRRQRRGNRYGAEHQDLRQRYKRAMIHGPMPCGRCGKPIDPGEPWDLDHLPDGTRRPSHAACNRRHTSRSRWGA